MGGRNIVSHLEEVPFRYEFIEDSVMRGIFKLWD